MRVCKNPAKNNYCIIGRFYSFYRVIRGFVRHANFTDHSWSGFYSFHGFNAKNYSDEELKKIEKRIKDGTATADDYLLQGEIERRKKEEKPSVKQNDNLSTSDFFDGFTPKGKLTRLGADKIQEMKKKGFDPHSAKPKQGSGAKIDLWKDEKGYIFYRKEDGKNYEPTFLKVKDYE